MINFLKLAVNASHVGTNILYHIYIIVTNSALSVDTVIVDKANLKVILNMRRESPCQPVQ